MEDTRSPDTTSRTPSTPREHGSLRQIPLATCSGTRSTVLTCSIPTGTSTPSSRPATVGSSPPAPRSSSNKRLREELAKLRVQINEDKSRTIDLRKGGSFGFLGYEFRLVQDRNRRWRPQPHRLRHFEIFGRHNSAKRRKCESPHKYCDLWWAWVDLNHRPRPYQGSVVRSYKNLQVPRGLPNTAQVIQDHSSCGFNCGLKSLGFLVS